MTEIVGFISPNGLHLICILFVILIRAGQCSIFFYLLFSLYFEPSVNPLSLSLSCFPFGINCFLLVCHLYVEDNLSLFLI